MAVELNCEKGCLTAVLKGDIDHHSAADMRICIDGELERTLPELLVLDFGGVSFMDSSGIGLILGRARNMTARGGKIAVSNPSPQIKKILKLSGLSSLIKQERK